MALYTSLASTHLRLISPKSSPTLPRQSWGKVVWLKRYFRRSCLTCWIFTEFFVLTSDLGHLQYLDFFLFLILTPITWPSIHPNNSPSVAWFPFLPWWGISFQCCQWFLNNRISVLQNSKFAGMPPLTMSTIYIKVYTQTPLKILSGHRSHNLNPWAGSTH